MPQKGSMGSPSPPPQVRGALLTPALRVSKKGL